MANIFDYLNWRGDISLSEVGLKNPDILVLARLSYLPFGDIIPENFDKSVTLREAADRFFRTDLPEKVFWKADPDFLRAAADSVRFGGLRLSGYSDIVDKENTNQFSALTITLDGGLRCISFRGTDNTLVGWQEGMSYYSLDVLPSQNSALEYFNKACALFDGDFILTGHSKGGNLALYSAVFTEEENRARIRAVYNHDGPGLNPEKLDTKIYDEVKKKLFTFVPQSSVFGMMLEHDEDFSIVKSVNKSLMQHDIYSWEIEGGDYLYLDRRTNSSYFIDHTLNDLADNMTPDEINEVIGVAFSVIESSKNENFDEFKGNWVKSSARMIKSFANLDKESRALIFKTLAKIIRSAKKNIGDIKS